MTETQTKSDLGLPRWPSGKESTCNKGDARDTGSIPGSERSLEKEMATNSSILAWEIPWTEEPGRLQSMGSQRVRHNKSMDTVKQPRSFLLTHMKPQAVMAALL